MKKIRKLWALMLSLLLVLALLAACGSSGGGGESSGDDAGSGDATGGAVTIRYGSADAEDAAVVQGIMAFKDYVESESGGEIKVETYINGVLGGDRELCEAIQLGTVDMSAVLGGVLANYDPDFNIFGLPYLWDSKEASYKAIDGSFGDKMKEKADAFGFKLMGYADGGTYQIGYKGSPITDMAGLKGLKIRVPEIDVDIALFTALGATPTPVSFSETYTAIEQGVVDGLELSVELMRQSQYFDAIDNITLTNHSESVFPILMSPALWNKLTPEQQDIVAKGVEKQVEVNREKAKSAQEDNIKVFEDMGKTVTTLDDAAMSEFRAVGDQVQKQYESTINPDLIAEAKSAN